MLLALPARYSVLAWAFHTADARHMPRCVWAAAPTPPGPDRPAAQGIPLQCVVADGADQGAHPGTPWGVIAVRIVTVIHLQHELSAPGREVIQDRVEIGPELATYVVEEGKPVITLVE